jgi:type I restriction-modification system DNA methylase subunit
MDEELTQLEIAEILDAIRELQEAIACYSFALWEQEMLEP